MAIARFRSTRLFHEETTDHVQSMLTRSSFLRSIIPQIQCVVQMKLQYTTLHGRLIQYITLSREEDNFFVKIGASIHTKQLIERQSESNREANSMGAIGLINNALVEQSIADNQIVEKCPEAHKMRELFSQGIGPWVPIPPCENPVLQESRCTVITKKNKTLESIMTIQTLASVSSKAMTTANVNLAAEKRELLVKSFTYMVEMTSGFNFPVDADVQRMSIDCFSLQWKKPFHSPHSLSVVLEGNEGKIDGEDETPP